MADSVQPTCGAEPGDSGALPPDVLPLVPVRESCCFPAPSFR